MEILRMHPYKRIKVNESEIVILEQLLFYFGIQKKPFSKETVFKLSCS